MRDLEIEDMPVRSSMFWDGYRDGLEGKHSGTMDRDYDRGFSSPAMTTLSRRVLEDSADEAQANLSDIQSIKAEAEALIASVRRNARLQGAAAGHLSDFANGLQDLIGDDLFLAERAAEQEARRLAVAAE